MLTKENLIRLYYLNHGTFEGIERANFMANSNYTSNDLYEILGYVSSSDQITPSEVYKGREEFVLNSYNSSYKNSLMSKFKAKDNSELIDILMYKGFLGLERKHISTLGEFRSCGVPSKFVNQKVSYALSILESKLNHTYVDGKSILSYRLKLLYRNPQDVLKTIDEFNLDLDRVFKVRYHDKNTSYIEDGVLYISEVQGYTESQCRDIMFRCYLLGLPNIPLYLRGVYIDSIPGCLSLFDLNSIHNMIDISNMCGCTVKHLLNSFGFNIPDPEEMYSKTGGYYSVYMDQVYYSNPSSELFLKLPINEFIEFYNAGTLSTLDLNLMITMRGESTDTPIFNIERRKPSKSKKTMKNSSVFSK